MGVALASGELKLMLRAMSGLGEDRGSEARKHEKTQFVCYFNLITHDSIDLSFHWVVVLI